MNTLALALSAVQQHLNPAPTSEDFEIRKAREETEDEEEDERDGLALTSQVGYTDAVDDYSNPTSPDDDSEELQLQERRAGLESDDEEWDEELVGLRPDNGYLPGQRMAEKGLDHEVFPKK